MADPSTAISRGCLKSVTAQDAASLPEVVVQVLQTKAIQNKQLDGMDRYRVILSDSEHFIQSMLATPLNSLVEDGLLKKGSLLRLTQYQPQTVKDKKIIIIVACEVLQEYGEPEKIGAPVNLEPAVGGPGGAQPGNVSANNFYGNRPAVKQEPVTQRSLPSRGNDPEHSAIYAIDQISPYAHRWTIQARVTWKGPIKTWHNQQGEGRLFSFNLTDDSGEIRATVFNSIGAEQFDALYESLEEGIAYYISSPCSVKMANKRFSNLNNDYELTFERDTRVERAADQSAAPQIRYSFTSIGDLQSVENNTNIDTIGVLKEVGEVNQITSKTTSKPYDKRDLTIVDNTLHQVRLTIWGSTAVNFDTAVGSVIAFKGVRVSDFGGRSLSLSSSGSMSVDPDIDEAHKLKGWYDAQGSTENFTSHASTLSSTGTQRKDAYKTVDQIQNVLGLDPDNAEYFTLKATIVYIRQENLYYPACPSDGCNKKVVEADPGVWRCEKCDKGYPKPQYRYIMSLNVQDHTGQMWLSGFDDTGRMILGKSADDVHELKEGEDPKQVEAIFDEANCKTYAFRCRAKLENFRDEQRPRYNILSTATLDFKAEAAKLSEIIRQYDLHSESLFV